MTLTFLFADIRNYTAFVEEHGDERATQLIARFRKLVRAQLAATGGGEVKTEGDSFYLVFHTAGQALRCAIAIMNQAADTSREGGPLPVGIGIHSGEPVPLEGQYVGSAVNIAARLGAAADAGELLISDTVRGLLRTSDLPGLTPREGLQLKGVRDAPLAFAVAWTDSGFSPGLVPAPFSARLGRRPLIAVAVSAIVIIILVGAIAATRLAQPAADGASGLPPHGVRLYDADLTRLGSSRAFVAVGNNQADRVVFAGDAIRFEISPASWASMSLIDVAPDDFVAEIAVRRVSGQGSIALFFRGSSGRQDQVVIFPRTGELVVQVVRSFESDPAPTRLFGPATRLPTGQSDIALAVAVKGPQITVFDRGVEVARATDIAASSGGVGIVANSDRAQPLVIELRLLRLYNP